MKLCTSFYLLFGNDIGDTLSGECWSISSGKCMDFLYSTNILHFVFHPKTLNFLESIIHIQFNCVQICRILKAFADDDTNLVFINIPERMYPFYVINPSTVFNLETLKLP